MLYFYGLESLIAYLETKNLEERTYASINKKEDIRASKKDPWMPPKLIRTEVEPLRISVSVGVGVAVVLVFGADSSLDEGRAEVVVEVEVVQRVEVVVVVVVQEVDD